MEYAKDCIATSLPNELALKMDDAEVGRLHMTIVVNVSASMSRRAWGLLRSLWRNLKFNAP